MRGQTDSASEKRRWTGRLSPTLLGRVAGAGVLAIILAITGFSIYSAVQSKQVVQSIQDNQRLTRAYEQTSLGFERFDAATNAVLAAKPERMDGALHEYDQALANLSGRLDEIQRFGNANDRAMVRGIRENFMPVAQAFREITASLPANPPGSPSELIISRSRELLDQRRDLVDKLRYSPDGSAPVVRAGQGLAEQPGNGPPTATFTSNYVTTFAKLANEKATQIDQLTADYSGQQRRSLIAVIVLNIAGVGLAVLFLVATRLFSLREARARMQMVRLQEAAHTDELTGLHNRRAFDDALSQATTLARENGVPLCLAMIDVDGFKQVNDTWGHDRGDALLRTLAQVLRSSARGTVEIFRIGGDEFAILFPETTADAAFEAADAIRRSVEANVRQATLSIGVARFGPHDSDAALRRASDTALYEAKVHGRNRVVVAATTTEQTNQRRAIREEPAA